MAGCGKDGTNVTP